MDTPKQPVHVPSAPKRPLIDADSAEDFAHQMFQLWRAGIIRATPDYQAYRVEFEIGF